MVWLGSSAELPLARFPSGIPIFISNCSFILAKSTFSGTLEVSSVQFCGGGKMGSAESEWLEGSGEGEGSRGAGINSRVWGMGTLITEGNGGPLFTSSVNSPIPRSNRFT